jgi:hypothetical protein
MTTQSSAAFLNPSDEGVLALLGRNRHARSYFAGSAIIAATLKRLPGDYDIHHPTRSDMSAAIESDRRAVDRRGGRCVILSETEDEIEAQIALGNHQVKVDWVVDGEPRLFGAAPDPVWGYCLHPFDICVHKLLQAADCGATKDLLDLLSVDERLFSLAWLASAAPVRRAGAQPSQLLSALEDWWLRRSAEMAPIKALLPKAQALLTQARRVCENLPQYGCVDLSQFRHARRSAGR